MSEVKVNIGWAGGWDEYIIDTTVFRKATPEERTTYQARVDKGLGGDPVLGYHEWLWTRFIKGEASRLVNHTDLVKIVRHTGGGD